MPTIAKICLTGVAAVALMGGASPVFAASHDAPKANPAKQHQPAPPKADEQNQDPLKQNQDAQGDQVAADPAAGPKAGAAVAGQPAPQAQPKQAAQPQTGQTGQTGWINVPADPAGQVGAVLAETGLAGAAVLSGAALLVVGWFFLLVRRARRANRLLT